MMVSPDERRLDSQGHTGLLCDLPDVRIAQILAGIDTTRGNLSPSLGMVTMVKDQQICSPLDIDDNPLKSFHVNH